MKDIKIRLTYLTGFALAFVFMFYMFSLQAFAFTSDEEMNLLSMYFKEDELVVSPTRALKRLSQVAENMEVITAEEIERMNAHTLPEVLEKVTGIFISFYGHDFGSDASIHIQGSNNDHVLVLLDGIPWNSITSGAALLNSVPVRIIKRIEIIKGPASSAWGSSLGGVINIVTKEAMKDRKPGGSVSVSLGESDTYDLSAEISADSGPVRYYLYAGRQESDGLRNGRWFNNDTFYSKFNITLSSAIDLMFTAGYNEPHINDGENDSLDLYTNSITRDLFTTASLIVELSDALTFDSSFYFYKHKFAQEVNEIGTGYWGGSPGEMFKNSVYNGKSNGFSAKLVYENHKHSAVLGTDYSYGTGDSRINAGASQIFWYSAPETTVTGSGITKWAVFLNDTIKLDKLSITPGIRHDYNNISGSFTSPSIGATYRAGRNTILRASIARGFNAPPLGFLSSGGLFLDPNPDLGHEKVWSYQAGIETWTAGYVKVKLNVFHHDIENDIVLNKFVGPAPTYNDKYFNQGRSKRDGVEIDLKTALFHDVSFRTGYAFVHQRTYYDTETSTDTYLLNLALRYDDRKSLFAELSGHYIWWDLDAADMPEYDTFIWDLNISKKLPGTRMNNSLFLTVHNVFSGSQYIYFEKKNPGMWVEAGLKVTF